MFFHIRSEYPHKQAFHPYYKYMFLLFRNVFVPVKISAVLIFIPNTFYFNFIIYASIPKPLRPNWYLGIKKIAALRDIFLNPNLIFNL